MKKLNLAELSKEIHFPVTQAIPDNWSFSPLWKRFFTFWTYRRKFKFRNDYVLWCPDISQFIFIPKYFTFDGASVPKLLSNIFNPTGVLLLGSGPHDIGYRYKGLIHVDLETGELYFREYSKSQLDKIFEILCKHESGMKIASTVATKLLSIVGHLGWYENRKKDSNLFNDHPELFVPGD
jgi:hypothetical protein